MPLPLGRSTRSTPLPGWGAQLPREPWQPAVLQIFESFGGQLQALGVPERAQFDCGPRS